ncbi:hypothetical protein [Leptolyngbya sp. KIOST-1]|uniref:hypothetical protein n=1 Tax=Leptolyngbya sp. KIOST-1 TaxID=1229172 RepID=UPI000A69187C|nr:hypothetical protein [Leptolyngbya sp. KIOST-1]
MATRVYRNLKWHRLLLALLTTVILADTMPHPQLAPGLLHVLALRVEAVFRQSQ